MELYLDMRQSDRKDLIEACIKLYARELKIDKNAFSLAVFSRKGMKEEIGAYGMAARLRDKVFIMDLDSRLSMEKLIEVVAHEMVHIKQFVRGQLITKGRSVFWLGQKVLRSKVHYYDQPWEKDAWSKEKLLSAKVYKILKIQEDKHEAKRRKMESRAK